MENSVFISKRSHNLVNSKSAYKCLCQNGFHWLVSGLLIAIVVLMSLLLAGGGVGMTGMSRTMEDMVFKMTKMTNGSDAVSGMLGKFPENQVELSVRQVFSTLANMERISSRVHYFLDHADPNLVNNVKDIVTRVSTLMSSLNENEVIHIKAQILGVAEHLNRVMTGIQPQHVNAILTMAAKIDATKLNELVENTKAIEERLKSLHEIKITI